MVYSFVLIIITTYLPYIFYTAGLSMMEPGKAAIVACIEPVVATIVGLIAFNESIGVLNIIGMILVVRTGLVAIHYLIHSVVVCRYFP